MFQGYEISVYILTFNGLFIFCSRLLVIKLLTFFLNQEIVPIFIKYSIAINNMWVEVYLLVYTIRVKAIRDLKQGRRRRQWKRR